MTVDPDFADHLAERYVDLCLSKWIERRLPVSCLVSAMVARGLELSARSETPEMVASGLERMAEAVRELEILHAANH